MQLLGAAIGALVLCAAGCTRHTIVDYSFHVAGTVVDTSGEAISNVRVTLQINGVAYQAVTAVSRTETYTDDRGRFSFAYLTEQPGQTYSLWFDKEGYESDSKEGASLSESPFHITLKQVTP